MNIIQQHRNIKARLDQVRTPRFKTWQIDGTINAVIDDLIKYKVAGVVENGKRVSFQKTRIIRDELYTIVKKRTSNETLTVVTPTGTYVVGDTLTGASSGAKAILVAKSGSVLTFRYITPFIVFNGTEVITSSSGGSCASSTAPIGDSVYIDDNIITHLPGSNSDDLEEYRYLLLLKITINGTKTTYCVPISHDDKPLLEENPYMRPSQDYPYKFYYTETAEGLECEFANGGADTITNVEIEFLAQPTIVNYGVEITNASGVQAGPTNLIAVDVTEYPASTFYQPGEEFELPDGAEIVSGKAVKSFVNTDLPIAMHEEIVKEAAKRLNMDVENFQKWKVMEESDQLDKQ